MTHAKEHSVAPMIIYPVPQLIHGQTSQNVYNAWVQERGDTLLYRDKERGRPYALDGTSQLYKDLINNAVVIGGNLDPFTGDALRWSQIETWDPKKDIGHDNFMKQFSLMPTVDHKDPYGSVIDFEICSWLINSCKNDQTPEEFIYMCTMISKYRKIGSKMARSRNIEGCPKVYFLPAFLNGICTEAVYLKWLDKRAEQLYVRDRDQRRPYGLAGSKESYKRAIHAAVSACGLYDPYTGERMKWELLGTWETDSPGSGSVARYREYYLLPTVDHCDPYSDALVLEICSWRINCCKAGLTPDEFVGVCQRVVSHCA
jgi:hypothetical protein